jgi:hypothetical protein
MSRPKARPRRSPHLRIESLETRNVPATGTLLVTAFADQNQNGSMDSGESGVAGVAVNYMGAGGSSYVTSGDDGSQSIVIEEGDYTYTALAAAGYT